MVEDLLKGFVKEDWVNGLDFSSLEKMNTSYVHDDLRESEDDIQGLIAQGRTISEVMETVRDVARRQTGNHSPGQS